MESVKRLILPPSEKGCHRGHFAKSPSVNSRQTTHYPRSSPYSSLASELPCPAPRAGALQLGSPHSSRASSEIPWASPKIPQASSESPSLFLFSTVLLLRARRSLDFSDPLSTGWWRAGAGPDRPRVAAEVNGCCSSSKSSSSSSRFSSSSPSSLHRRRRRRFCFCYPLAHGNAATRQSSLPLLPHARAPSPHAAAALLPPLLVPHIVPHGKSRRGEGSLIFFDLLSDGVLLHGRQARGAPARRRPPPRMVQDTRPRGRVRLLTIVGPLAPHLPRFASSHNNYLQTPSNKLNSSSSRGGRGRLTSSSSSRGGAGETTEAASKVHGVGVSHHQ